MAAFGKIEYGTLGLATHGYSSALASLLSELRTPVKKAFRILPTKRLRALEGGAKLGPKRSPLDNGKNTATGSTRTVHTLMRPHQRVPASAGCEIMPFLPPCCTWHVPSLTSSIDAALESDGPGVGGDA